VTPLPNLASPGPRRVRVDRARGIAASFAAALLASTVLVLGGCGSRADAGIAAEQARSVPPDQAFLERIPDAPMTVAYSGTRHVLLNYAQAGVPSVLAYDEEVFSDGHGQFAIVPGQVTAPAMNQDQAQLFAILQERRDGFFYRFRDFRIRDWRAFLRNWRVTDSGTQETVAGRSTEVLEIRHLRVGPSWYRAWVDPTTALVMRAEEYDGSNTLLSRVEFLTFTLTPDLQGRPLHGDRNPATAFDPHSDTTGSLGFQVKVPTILPPGYQLERSESLSDGTSTWARLGFGDGVDEIFLLQSPVPSTPPPPGTPPEMDVGPRSVRVFQVGPWTVLQAKFSGMRTIVVGKADQQSLLRMLKSAVG
jgi:hypothetical protein